MAKENEHGTKSHVVKSIAQCENYLDVTFGVTAGQEKEKRLCYQVRVNYLVKIAEDSG